MDEEADNGPPATVEIHINLGQPELQDRDGKPDVANLERLLGILAGLVAEATPDRAKGVVLSGDTKTPLAYWVFTYKTKNEDLQ